MNLMVVGMTESLLLWSLRILKIPVLCTLAIPTSFESGREELQDEANQVCLSHWLSALNLQNFSLVKLSKLYI